MKPGDLVKVICDENKFSDNYIKYMLNTIGDDPKPYGLIISVFAKSEEKKIETITFYTVLIGGKEHLIDEDSLELICES